MLVLVSGGSGSGKSLFAEGLICQTAAARVYIATMQVWDEEGAARVAWHRALRAGKGFSTLECPTGLAQVGVPPNCAVLLEDLSNLMANEWFGAARDGAVARVLAGVETLAASARLTVVVTNELFSDGVCYDGETAEYLTCMAGLNRALAARAELVYEVVCGIPLLWKGEEK